MKNKNWNIIKMIMIIIFIIPNLEINYDRYDLNCHLTDVEQTIIENKNKYF